MFSNKYEDINQLNYTVNAKLHANFKLNSTLYLAYRDSHKLLKKHLFDRSKKSSYRVLDYGCGAGFSTSIYMQTIKDAGYEAEICGIDINQENLAIARDLLPEANFIPITESLDFNSLGKFDLIICNFVLVEHPYEEMLDIINKSRVLLESNGVLITTNTTSKTYNSANKWYTLENDFPVNSSKNDNERLQDDQPVSLAVRDPLSKIELFRFFDFYHSGRSYQKAFSSAGLQLMQTHKPLGIDEDGIPWESEKIHSPYKIHILYPKNEYELGFVPYSNSSP